MKFKTIRQKALLEAGPEEVYEAYVDPKRHEAFTGSKATGTGKVGGRFTAWDGYISGRYLELEKGRRIVQEWKTTEWPAGYPPSVVEITLRAKGSKTELTMVHSKAPAEQAESYAEGWLEWYWRPMQRYFSGKGSA